MIMKQGIRKANYSGPKVVLHGSLGPRLDVFERLLALPNVRHASKAQRTQTRRQTSDAPPGCREHTHAHVQSRARAHTHTSITATASATPTTLTHTLMHTHPSITATATATPTTTLTLTHTHTHTHA